MPICTCNNANFHTIIYTFISKFGAIPPNKHVVKIRKIESDSDTVMEKKTTLFA